MSRTRPDRLPDADSYSALRAARQRGDVDTLIEALAREALAANAAKFLGDMGVETAVDALVATLSASDPHARAAAAVSLGKLKAKDAASSLESLARQDPVPFVRAAALEAAGIVGGLEPIRDLVHRGLKDPNWQPRFVSANLLGREGIESDLALLRQAKSAESWWRRGPYRRALRRIRNRAADPRP